MCNSYAKYVRYVEVRAFIQSGERMRLHGCVARQSLLCTCTRRIVRKQLVRVRLYDYQSGDSPPSDDV